MGGTYWFWNMFMIAITIYVYFSLILPNFFSLQQRRLARTEHCSKDDFWSGRFQFFIFCCLHRVGIFNFLFFVVCIFLFLWLSLSMAMLWHSCFPLFFFSLFLLFSIFYCFYVFFFCFYVFLVLFYSLVLVWIFLGVGEKNKVACRKYERDEMKVIIHKWR